MSINSMLSGTISEMNCKERKLTLYFPKEYDHEPLRQFPIMLLQDGVELFEDILFEIEENVRKEITVPIVLVGIDSERRNDEYTPWPHPALVDNFAPFSGEGDAYLNELENEIIPFIQTHYRVSTNTYDWAIGGASLGGLISIYAMYKKNDLFKKFMLLSSSLWYQEFIEFMRTEQLDPSLQAYMYIGEKEGITKANIQRFMVANNTLGFDIVCTKLKSPTKQITFESDPEGIHDDPYFKKYFIRGLIFLFPKSN